jgi:RNA polymerase sigma factor (sigma-70 family)
MKRLGAQIRPLSEAEYDRIEELASSTELRERVSEGLARLSVGQREVLRLRVVEERSYADVATELGVSEQTARTRGCRALRALREYPGLRELMEATDNA